MDDEHTALLICAAPLIVVAAAGVLFFRRAAQQLYGTRALVSAASNARRAAPFSVARVSCAPITVKCCSFSLFIEARHHVVMLCDEFGVRAGAAAAHPLRA